MNLYLFLLLQQVSSHANLKAKMPGCTCCKYMIYISTFLLLTLGHTGQETTRHPTIWLFTSLHWDLKNANSSILLALTKHCIKQVQPHDIQLKNQLRHYISSKTFGDTWRKSETSASPWHSAQSIAQTFTQTPSLHHLKPLANRKKLG